MTITTSFFVVCGCSRLEVYIWAELPPTCYTWGCLITIEKFYLLMETDSPCGIYDADTTCVVILTESHTLVYTVYFA